MAVNPAKNADPNAKSFHDELSGMMSPQEKNIPSQMAFAER